MKIYKKHINKLIEILKEKGDLLKNEDDYFKLSNNKLIVSSFKLPEKFFILVSEENISFLKSFHWINHSNFIKGYKYIVGVYYGNFHPNQYRSYSNSKNNFLDSGFIKITTEQFKEYILNKKEQNGNRISKRSVRSRSKNRRLGWYSRNST